MTDDLASLIFNSASFFDAKTSEYTSKPAMKRPCHRALTMSDAGIMPIMILAVMQSLLLSRL